MFRCNKKEYFQSFLLLTGNWCLDGSLYSLRICSISGIYIRKLFMEENMCNSQRIFYQNGFERLKDILTLVFFNPKLQHRTFRHFNPRLFRYEFLNHGVEKFMVEMQRMSHNFEWTFGILEFSQKMNKRICRSSKNKFVCSFFLGEFEETKSPFKIMWPLI